MMRKTGNGKSARVLSAVMAAAMVLTSCPVSAGAAQTAEGSQTEADADGVVVLFEGQENLTEAKVKKQLANGTDRVSVTVDEVWNFEGEDCSVALVHGSGNADRLAAKLEQRSDVKYAEKNFKIHAMSISQDPYSDLQWSMQDIDAAPHVSTVWKTVEGTDKIVAVVDTGVDYTHPELKDNMWINPYNDKGLKGKYGYDFIDGDPDPLDENGHGSHCAGIIGAAGDNGIGISGVNKRVKIMALRILDAEGESSLSHCVAAYHYINKAMELGAPVVAINNSWGGGSTSKIFDALVDKVGEKGAVTVCAAGNESSDFASHPATTDSPYLISVAATREDGMLASYSNYGDWVDLAAPGTDILSTVCYNCYNPRLYGQEQSAISAVYCGYEQDGMGLIPEQILVNGKALESREEEDAAVFYDESGRTITLSRCDNGFLGGHALRLVMTGIKANDSVYIPIVSYTAVKDAAVPVYLSMTARAESKEGSDSLLGLYETKKSADLAAEEIEFGASDMMPVGEGDSWDHMAIANDYIGENEDTERQFVLGLNAESDGTYTIDLDDIGLSRPDLPSEDVFGKYDYMSGTSMATPYVTGAVALWRAKLEKEGETGFDAVDVINDLTSMAKETPSLNISEEKGLLDFRCPATRAPRIGNVYLEGNGTYKIVLTGSGLDPKAADFSIEIEKGEVTKTLTGKDVTGDSHKLSFADNGWVNHLVNIMVTANGRSALKDSIYLVKGKKTYTPSEVMIDSREGYTTDGKLLYWLDAENATLCYQDPVNTENSGAWTIDPEIFSVKQNPDQEYRFSDGKAVYCNGSIYAIVEYGAAEQKEFGSGYGVYDGNTYLLQVDTQTGEAFAKIMTQPNDLSDSVLSAYNGKLYLIGGYKTVTKDGKQTQEISTAVKVYDPAKNSWSAGKSLPEGRYGGVALQTGNVLVYTLGKDKPEGDVGEDYYTQNLIFDGSNWKKSKAAALKQTFYSSFGGVGITEGGLIYAGYPADGLGDSYIYNVKEDSYKDTGYNLLTDVDNELSFVLPMEQKVYACFTTGGFMDEDATTEVVEMPIKSGFVNIEQSIEGLGMITGPKIVPPGNDVKLTFTADEGYYIGSLLIDGKAVSLEAESTTYTHTFKQLMKNTKVSLNIRDPYDVGDNTLTVKGRKVKVKAKALSSKKGVSVKAKKTIKIIDPGQGELYYTLVSVKKAVKVQSSKKQAKGKKAKKAKKVQKFKKVKNFNKYIKLNGTNGMLTLKKGLKKGTYKLKVEVYACGDELTYDTTGVATVTLVVK